MKKSGKFEPCGKMAADKFIGLAIDRAEKEFRESGQLPRFRVHENPASGKCKLTPFYDCEDGMYRQHWRVP